MNKQKLLVVGQILLPAVCMLAGYFSIMRQVRRGNEAREEKTRIERQLNIVDLKLKELEKPRPFIRYPAAQVSTQEQPEFLNSMRTYSAAARVTIVKWLSQAPIAAQGAAGPSGSALSAQPAHQNPNAALAQILPPGVTAVPAAVQVSGPFNNVRQFLYMLLADRRLINLSDVRWTRTEKWPITGVEFTLTRYISNRPPAMVTAQMAALDRAQTQSQGTLSSQTQGTDPSQQQGALPSPDWAATQTQKTQAVAQSATITSAARTGN